MPAVGDIIRIYAATVGYDKYHVCVYVGISGAAHQFLYLNSDPNYDDSYAVDCDRVPCLPLSNTGKTVFSFSMVPRYTDAQLSLYNAEKLGELDAALAAELVAFGLQVRSLPRSQLQTVLDGLRSLCEQNA